MDVKDLRTEATLSERNNDGSKYTQGGVVALQCNKNKSYHDIGSHSLAKAEGLPVRPCAVIGPDRVVPPLAPSDAFLKKSSVETTWPSPENMYRRPPDYPHRLSNQNPSRNISPRQTFQENMQRINVPPTYNAVRHSDSANYNHNQDRNVPLSKNAKPNMVPEAKYCDVPYTVNPLPNELKNIREPEIYMPSVNPTMTRTAQHVWPPGSVNVNASRTYSANEPYQYTPYSSCASQTQRPSVMPIPRSHRTIQEDPGYVYPDYYADPSARYKPYPHMKERYTQPRYEYIGNYPAQFHPPPPVQSIKYDIPKSSQSHPYPMYPHLKYLDNRVSEPIMEGYQRQVGHPPHYNPPFRSQVTHPTYAQIPGNTPQKVHPYPPEAALKAVSSNKLHYDNNTKMLIDYENARSKAYPMSDNYFVNEMGRYHQVKNPMVMPNYSPLGVRSMTSQQYYLKDNPQMKQMLEHMPHFRNFEPYISSNPMLRHAPQFSPNTLAISPTDSSASNDTSHTHGTSQEDCGYVSQSSTASVRSVESGIYRLPHEHYRRHDFKYGPVGGSITAPTKVDVNSKDKQKQIDVRQFLSMWNEGEEDNSENNSTKEIVIQTGSSDPSSYSKQHGNNQDQLYVLGLVNVPSEELSKYEHIQKISKLPENIKGYNNLELYSRFEEAMESCNSATFKVAPKEYPIIPIKDNPSKQLVEALPRPVSPLDVEAKISQSVIHKEVGCNFEIRPCTPKILNVEVGAPAQNILGERVIEKVTNPLSTMVKSPISIKPDENSNCHSIKKQENAFSISDNPSCKMTRSPYSTNHMDSVKTNYSLQDLEINSGVCLASLPRLDNEIELNFPEVNQQFINANKRDSLSTSNNSPLNNYQEESGFSESKTCNIDSENAKVGTSDTEKTINKLSKYRKSKINPTNNYVPFKEKFVRTDSVIIKNPENVKNIEDKLLENSLSLPMNLSSPANLSSPVNLSSPMNLSSQSSQWHNSSDEHDESKDIALDFSLNKSGNDLPIIEAEKEIPIKSFEIANAHLSCENILPREPKLSRVNSPGFGDSVVKSKEIIDECTKPDSYNLKAQVSHEEQKLGDNPCKDFDNVESISVDNNISLCSEISSVSENRNTNENKTRNTNQYVNNNDGKEDLQNLCENIVTIEPSSKKDIDRDESKIPVVNICNEEALQHDLKTHECSEKPLVENECDNYSENHDRMTEIFSPKECNDVKNSEETAASQIDNEFEHDEISANLEKMFRESDEDVSRKEDSFNTANSTLITSCHHSKELYSPWFQKLITYNEGFCSSHNKSQKGCSDTNSVNYDHVKVANNQPNVTLLKNELSEGINDDKDEEINPTPIDIVNHKNVTEDESCAQDGYLNNKTNSINVTKEYFAVADNNTQKIFQTSAEILSSQDTKNVYTKSSIYMPNHRTGRTVKSIKREHKKHKLNKVLKKRSSRSFGYSVKFSEDIKRESTESKKIKTKEENLKILISRKQIVKNCDKLSDVSSKSFKTDAHGETGESNEDLLSRPALENITHSVPSISGLTKVEQEVIKLINEKNIDTSGKNVSCTLQETSINDDCTVYYSKEKESLSNGNLDNSAKNISNSPGDKHASESITDILTDNSVVTIDKTEISPIIMDEDENDSEKLCNIMKICEPVIEVQDAINQQKLVESKDSDKLYNSVACEPAVCSAENPKESEDSFEDNADEIEACSIDTANIVITVNSETIPEDEVENPNDLPDTPYADRLSYQTTGNQLNITLNDELNVDNDTEKGSDKSKNNQSNIEDMDKELESLNNHKSDESFAVHQSNVEKEKTYKCFVNQENLAFHKDNRSSENCTEHPGEEKENKCIQNLQESQENTGDIKETVKNCKNTINNEVILENLKYDCDCNRVNFTETLNLESKTNIFERATPEEVRRSIEEDASSKNVVIFNELNEGDIKNLFEEKDSKENDTIENITKSSLDIETIYNDDKCNDTQTSETKQKDQLDVESITIALKIDNPKENKIDGSSITVRGEISYDEDKVENNNDRESLTEKVCIEAVSKSSENDKSDDIIKETLSEPIIENSFNNDIDNYIALVTENKDEVKHGDEENKTEINSVLPTDREKEQNITDENNSELESKIQNANENSLTDNLPDKWIEYYNGETTAAPDDYVLCENHEETLCYPVVENSLIDIENETCDIPETPIQELPVRHRLKRSFSDSALNTFKNKDSSDRHLLDNTPMWPPKRQKIFEFNHTEQQVLSDKICNLMQNSRRNSVSSYFNAENVSFCILIDNDCILTDETEGEKICFAEVTDDCLTEVNTDDNEDNVAEVVCCSEENELDLSDSVMLGFDGEKSIQESWLDDVACVETVVSDDVIDETYNNTHISPRDELIDYDESGMFNSDMSEFNHDVDYANEQVISNNDSEFENMYISPRDDIKITHNEKYQDINYSNECFESVNSDSHSREITSRRSDYSESIFLPDNTTKLPEDKENKFENISSNDNANYSKCGVDSVDTKTDFHENVVQTEISCNKLIAIDPACLPESSVDKLLSYKKDDDLSSTPTSSSPEVSSTTFEEKSSSILLKITNYNGSRVSEINEINGNRPRCKFTESKEYSNSQGNFPKRPLMTKAAQKYIPPIKESIRDLKVKLPLPQQSLLKLKKLKQSKSEPKVIKHNILTIPKNVKPKPNFEDVLKNIDEVQIKMHKEKNKKLKNVVPKVVIKKTLNGSHYTSSTNRQTFNPDLTGRKWQPWVFIEKNSFIDTMAIRKQTRAIYSHRTKTYVLADKFKKYKSVSSCSTKFVISQPKSGESSKGQLKYTIRLKHSY